MFTMSIVGAIVGEFIASDRGLGYIIISAQYTMTLSHLLFIDRYSLWGGTVLGGSVGRASYNAMGIQKGTKRLKKAKGLE